MKEPTWVLQDTVTAVHQMLLAEHGGLSEIRDEALLKPALARPHQLFANTEDLSMPRLAAAYSFGLAKNHPFVDGNKRVALTVAAVFLELNGYTLVAPESETVVIFEGLAAGNLEEASVANWFKDSSILKK